MSYVVKIDSDELIDALDNHLGNVYPNIKDDDIIQEIRLSGGKVEITIGKMEA